ncbi:MAG: hypothetical protein K5662_00530 [Lachnospiraceae bacterium]|nr:hypothetical protein [Lachnospiraceae bacterium]
MEHRLNVIVSHTTTIVGAGIRFLFGGFYNHCAVALDDDLSVLYSFARKNRHLWFTGCFCTEKLEFYKAYKVYTIPITDEEYEAIRERLRYYGSHLCIYNYPGAALLPFNITLNFKRSYMCSTFVASILENLDEVQLEKQYGLYNPMDIKHLLDKYEQTA